MKRYVSVTLQDGLQFDNHKEAWNHYDNKEEKIKGVYLIKGDNQVEGLNISCDVFSHQHQELKDQAKLIANRGNVYSYAGLTIQSMGKLEKIKGKEHIRIMYKVLDYGKTSVRFPNDYIYMLPSNEHKKVLKEVKSW